MNDPITWGLQKLLDWAQGDIDHRGYVLGIFLPVVIIIGIVTWEWMKKTIEKSRKNELD